MHSCFFQVPLKTILTCSGLTEVNVWNNFSEWWGTESTVFILCKMHLKVKMKKYLLSTPGQNVSNATIICFPVVVCLHQPVSFNIIHSHISGHCDLWPLTTEHLINESVNPGDLSKTVTALKHMRLWPVWNRRDNKIKQEPLQCKNRQVGRYSLETELTKMGTSGYRPKFVQLGFDYTAVIESMLSVSQWLSHSPPLSWAKKLVTGFKRPGGTSGISSFLF